MYSVNPRGYETADFAYRLPSIVKKKIGSNSFVQRRVANFLSSATDFDYHRFSSVDIGKRLQSTVPDPPMGAYLFFLYFAGAGSRMFRAWQRGREKKDYREVGDVARRDFIAMTMILFALKPITKGVSKLVERATKIPLFDSKTRELLTYSQLKNYKINTPEVIQALLEEGHANVLNKALDEFNQKSMPHTVSKPFEVFKQAVNTLGKKYHTLNKQEQREEAKKIFAHLEKADKSRLAFLSHTAKNTSPSPVLKKQSAELQKEFSDALVHLAQKHRLPADIVSFAVVVGLTGWFPVWFNQQWNKRQFRKHHHPAQPAPSPPVSNKTLLNSSSSVMPSALYIKPAQTTYPYSNASGSPFLLQGQQPNLLTPLQLQHHYPMDRSR